MWFYTLLILRNPLYLDAIYMEKCIKLYDKTFITDYFNDNVCLKMNF